MSIPSLTFSEAKLWLRDCIESKVTPVLIGPPGVGKTALAAEVAEDVQLPLVTLLGSTCEPTDIGGFPVVVDGVLQRIPMKQIQECVVEPKILFLDELTTVPMSVQAPLMRGLLEHWFGDMHLHEGSAVIAACNDPAHAPSAFGFTAATGSRLLQATLEPTHQEVQQFFAKRLGAPGTMLREEALDFAATLSQDANLLQMTPPKHSIQTGQPWGCPRAWERGLRAYSKAYENGHGMNDSDLPYKLLAGAISEEIATRYNAIRKLRKFLPTIEAIASAPDTAQVPTKTEQQIAIIGLIARVADRDVWAAWVYTARLHSEFGMVCARMLLPIKTGGVAGPWKKAGQQARIDALAKARMKLDGNDDDVTAAA